MELHFIDKRLTPELKSEMKELSIVEGLPFTLSEDLAYDHEINRFLSSLPSPKRQSPKTWGSYAQAISMFMRFLKAIDTNWKEVTKETLLTYHRIRRQSGTDAIQPVKSGTWKTDIIVIKLLYTWAYDKGMISKLPFKLEEVYTSMSWGAVQTTDLHEKSEHEDIKYIHIDDFKNKVLPALQKRRNSVRDTALAMLIISTGMRIEEVYVLKLSQIPNPDSESYSGKKTCPMQIVGKGKKRRTVRVPKHVLRDIHYYIENDRADACERYLSKNKRKKYASDYLFLTQSGKRPTLRTLQYAIERAGQLAGIHLHPHMLRHSFAIFQLSSMIREAVGNNKKRPKGGDLSKYNSVFQDPIRQLQKLMGHAEIKTLFIYLDYLDEADEMIDNTVAEWTDTFYELNK